MLTSFELVFVLSITIKMKERDALDNTIKANDKCGIQRLSFFCYKGLCER